MIFSRFYLPLLCLLSLFFVFSCGLSHPSLEPCENTNNQGFTCDTKLSFSSCVEHYRSVVRECRLDLDQDFSKSPIKTLSSSVNPSIAEPYNADFVVKYNAPFELIPDANLCANKPKKGIALVHGYSDSSYSFKSLGEYFQSQCFTVRVILLPGHGTRVGDLARVSYQDWVNATSFVVSTFVNDDSFAKIYVGGFSTGVAALVVALDQLESRERINGFLMFSPAFSILDQTSRFATLLSKVVKFSALKEQIEHFRYQTNSYAAIGELSKLFSIARDITIAKNIKLPVFLYFSREDSTINQEVTLELFKDNMPSTQSVAYMVYSSTINTLSDSTDTRIKAIDIFETEGVTTISASHIFPLGYSEDLFYGPSGVYKQCSHYNSDDESVSYNTCMSDDNLLYFGERLDVILDNQDYSGFRRLSYNPIYQGMLGLIDNFLNSL